jgi:hypothetical protein
MLTKLKLVLMRMVWVLLLMLVGKELGCQLESRLKIAKRYSARSLWPRRVTHLDSLNGFLKEILRLFIAESDKTLIRLLQ